MQKKNQWPSWLLYLFLFLTLLSIAAIHAFSKTRTVDFLPINGSFQNYNPVRRFLDGQIPYKDFSLYLGAGQLLTCSLLLIFTGNNFAASLFSMYFLTLLCFQFTVLVTTWLFTDNKKWSFIASIFSSFMMTTNPRIIQNLPGGMSYTLKKNVLQPGNSARMVRSFAPILMVLCAVLFCWGLTRLKTKIPFFAQKYALLLKCSVSFVAGCLVLWSNDLGVANYLCFSLAYFFSSILYYKKNILKIITSIIQYIFCSSLGLLSSILLLSRGHLAAWFESTTGISGYQFWYYNGQKGYFWYKFDPSVSTKALLVIGIVCIGMALLQKDWGKKALRLALLSSLCLSAFVGANIYKLLSGGINKEISLILMFALGIATVTYLCTRFILPLLSKISPNIAKPKRLTAMVLAVVLLTSSAFSCFKFQTEYSFRAERSLQNTNTSDVYLEELHGYLNPVMAQGIRLAKERLAGKAYFSTYASALEVATGQFQPTEYDYIIHVLGDNARKEYMDTFLQQKLPYAVTVHPNNVWEPWIRNANWYFYRELYNYYEPEFQNNYQVFWRLSAQKNRQQVEYSIQITQHDYRHSIISVTTADPTLRGTIDLAVSYETQNAYNGFSAPLHKMVAIKPLTELALSNDSFVNFNIPAQSEKYYLPVTIHNGYGEIELLSYPEIAASLSVSSAEVLGFFPTFYNTLFPENFNGGAFVAGVTNNQIIFKYSRINWNRLSEAKSLVSQTGVSVEIQSVQKIGTGFIIVTTNSNDNSSFSYPNCIKIE